MNNTLTYTKRHTTTLSWLYLAALLLLVYHLIISVKGFAGFSLSSENTTTRMILNQVPVYFFSLLFWTAVGWVTKEKIGAALALLIKVIFISYSLYQMINLGFDHEVNNRFWFNLGASVLAYLVFGLVHFKDKRGLYLVLIYLAIRGLSYAAYSYPFYNVINSLLDMVGFEDLMEIRISTGERSYRTVNVFSLFTSALLLPFFYLIFFFIYDRIKGNGKLDWTLRTAFLPERMSRATFSMMYWAMRIPLFIAALGALNFFMNTQQKGSTGQMVFGFVCYLFGIFIAASFYRNFLSSYYISRGKQPGWLYWFLNVPILHILAWLYALTLAPYREKIDPEAVHEDGGVLMRAEKLQAGFRSEGRNTGIKVILILFIIGSSLFQLNRMGLRLDGESTTASLQYLVYFFITLGLVIWYLNDRRAMLILFFLQAILILVGILTQAEALLRPAVMAGLVNLFVFYALFHFDHLKFEQVGEEETELKE